ncbi:MAG: cytochrome c family protein [Planctomycetes bacterium]|nr:cytochrome c family protein [Planctomycetota bacterium]
MVRIAKSVLVIVGLAWAAMLAITIVDRDAPVPRRVLLRAAPAAKRSLPPAEPMAPLPRRYSCSASRCHGALPATDDDWRSAAAVWNASDPHATAHAVLFSERSQRMVRLLGGPADSADPAMADFLRENCASCHAPGGSASVAAPKPAEFDLSAGVRCEACHGDAELWFVKHRTADWQNLSPEAKAELGFLDTKHPGVRAEMCASCHVGSPGRDVTHDLIAAGHPRLNFEFAAYWRALPRHWDDAAERAESRARLGIAADDPTQLDAAMWRVGQIVSAKAWLRLLHARANGQPWPEFAAYDCAACHHDLRPQRRKQGNPVSPENLGALPLGEWDLAMPRLLAEHAAETDEAGEKLLQELILLERAMQRPLADAQAVQRAAEQALQALEASARDLDRRRMLAALAADEEASSAPASWDSAAQWRLAVEALHGESPLQNDLQRLHNVLNSRGDHAAAVDAVRRQLRTMLEP